MATESRVVDGEESRGGPISFDTWMLLLALSGYLLVREASLALLVLGVLVPICMAYLALDGASRIWRQARHRRVLFRLKLALIFVAVLSLLLMPALEQMARRRAEGAHLCVHDGLIQTEEAVRLLLEGKNPYVEDYVGTPLEQAPFPRSPNPALYHLAYLPLTFLLHLPLAFLGWHLWGWYDGRVLYVALLLLSLPLSATLARREERRLGLVIALGLNLPLLTFTAEGRNDILGIFWVLLSLCLALRDRRSLSMVVMGLGCASKQTVWFGLPFYFLYLLKDDISWQSLWRLALQAWPFYLTMALVVGPFLLWDPRAFVDDTFLYLTGHSPTSYPMWGIGIGFLLQLTGLVGSDTAYVPFWIPQLAVGVPVFCLLLVYQVRHNGLGAFWFGFAAFQLVMGYFSRIFHNNYLAIIASSFSFAFLSEAVQTRNFGGRKT
ncbi:MAG: hypothetical protein KAX26_07970 [Anaerolineae bacterium]|nr:hypothetical protein [Anaerolineae bacterium]